MGSHEEDGQPSLIERLADSVGLSDSQAGPGAGLGAAIPGIDVLSGVKTSVWQLVRDNLVFFSTRVMAAGALLHLFKSAARRAVRRRSKRVRRTVHFATEALLPSGFFGPALGIAIGMMELTGAIPSLNLRIPSLPRRHSSSSRTPTPSASLPAASARLLTAVLQQTGAAAGAVVGPAPPAVALQDVVPGIPADNLAASVGAMVGLPVAPSSPGSE